MFENVNPYDILGYGVIGLGFLLALLAFRLLAQEQKREPRSSIIKATYTFMAFSVVLCVIGFAAQVYGNGDEGEISDPSAQACCEELDDLQLTSIATGNLTLLDNKRFPSGIEPSAAIDTIRNLAAESEELQTQRKHYAHRLFLLEKMIPEFGSNISLRLDSTEKEDAFKLIQKIMRDLDFYNGPIDGARPSTHDALIRFQKDYNQRSGLEVFNAEREFGVFGYRTLEAVRSAYRRARS